MFADYLPLELHDFGTVSRQVSEKIKVVATTTMVRFRFTYSFLRIVG